MGGWDHLKKKALNQRRLDVNVIQTIVAMANCKANILGDEEIDKNGKGLQKLKSSPIQKKSCPGHS